MHEEGAQLSQEKGPQVIFSSRITLSGSKSFLDIEDEPGQGTIRSESIMEHKYSRVKLRSYKSNEGGHARSRDLSKTWVLDLLEEL